MWWDATQTTLTIHTTLCRHLCDAVLDVESMTAPLLDWQSREHFKQNWEMFLFVIKKLLRNLGTQNT